ncbi:hypothetical protein Dshi_3879 (plasmid) [Dinoroseobacter shibae DFL 12 = DSM 16493]|uniref:Uncharacterized protein n=1 Tax=Dinoroseobacter shibae (strain DSM 16493 / NCIMB 14021 / DFL 12) TaxID=398580 RepID=A8LTP0_DINSH|nr:hypothetical protein [Dinoroseobacter shibae]ABV95607.1 hypothetical protein Dshi_3879 [Dinoroseobacter shibae DFL 12 = DSM 16493]URF48815.1 hypothetical protein M8008_19905 [Dinoroseobacter shibae]URF53127.1 hypothetical protein M8007_19930 [Dinoroseobacter shibae]
MSIDYNDLQSKGVDIAAAINETFLNKFATSHHTANPSLYSGKQRFTQFDNDIEIAFKANTPLTFDFSRQVSRARFKRLWLQHLKIKGVPESTKLDEVLTTPPNVSLGCESVIFEVKIFDGKSNDVLLTVDFDWSLLTLAAISLDDGKLSMEPVRIGFSQRMAIIEEAIAARVSSKLSTLGVQQKPERPATFGDPSDPVWCAKLEKMIILLLNQVLAVQIANFIAEFELPRAIEVADGIAIDARLFGDTQRQSSGRRSHYRATDWHGSSIV